MLKAITRMARPTCMSLLATGLSGCAYFTESVDEDQVHCPAVNLPHNHQPFDFTARKRLQRLIDRDSDANDGPAKGVTFIRLNEQGIPLTSRQAIYDSEPWARDYSAVPWACVKDERTSLIWEVKKYDPSLRGRQWTYTWYEPALIGQHNYAGRANGGVCHEGSACDTEAYVAAVNATKLCGFDDWRLPSNVEFQTLLDRNKNCPGTCINQQFFPNTARGGYWSSSQFGSFMCYAWGVDFELGDVSGANKNTPLSVRLVRGKWRVPTDDSEIR